MSAACALTLTVVAAAATTAARRILARSIGGPFGHRTDGLPLQAEAPDPFRSPPFLGPARDVWMTGFFVLIQRARRKMTLVLHLRLATHGVPLPLVGGVWGGG